MSGDGGGPDADSGSDPDADLVPDPERAAVLREIAEEVRGESSESEHVAAILYRVSDLYDPDEETTPEDIYVSVRNVMRIKERGTLERDRG